jgi:hypothetical protein
VSFAQWAALNIEFLGLLFFGRSSNTAFYQQVCRSWELCSEGCALNIKFLGLEHLLVRPSRNAAFFQQDWRRCELCSEGCTLYIDFLGLVHFLLGSFSNATFYQQVCRCCELCSEGYNLNIEFLGLVYLFFGPLSNDASYQQDCRHCELSTEDCTQNWVYGTYTGCPKKVGLSIAEVFPSMPIKYLSKNTVNYIFWKVRSIWSCQVLNHLWQMSESQDIRLWHITFDGVSFNNQLLS